MRRIGLLHQKPRGIHQRTMDLRSKTRDEVKAHFLAIINGRVVKIKEDDPEWFKKFYKGTRKIMRKIIELNPDLLELAKKAKEDRGNYNVEGTTVNYVMCKLENEALMIAFEYLKEQKFEVGALVFDGLMIYK